MNPMPKYGFKVFWSDEDQAYIATCPDFPGVSAFGNTTEQALAEAEVALRLAVETYQEEGWPLPEPQLQPPYSGQFRVRLPKSLHAQLAEQANVEGVSLNTVVVTYLSEAVGGRMALTQTQRADHHMLAEGNDSKYSISGGEPDNAPNRKSLGKGK
jgi:predicted RNase H-like HicB family nuclease